MLRTLLKGTAAARYEALLKALHAGVAGMEILPPDAEVPSPAAGRLALPLSNDGVRLGLLVLKLLPGTDAAACALRIQPAVATLAQTLATADATARANELRLLRLANELDIDFPDDARLDKALSAVALRTGVELAWLSAPRSQFSVAVRGHDQEMDPGVQSALAGLRARVAPLTGKLRRPLIINGKVAGAEHSAECRLLLVPLFVGRRRHAAWLVLANPLSAAPFGGWQMLAALTLGQAIARRLELDLDRRTGLFNRGGLESALPRLRTRRGSLLLLDIDGLQSVNQMYGMAAGDAAIMALARLLVAPLLPPNALVARMLGDQFAIVLPGMEAHQAAQIATQVQNAAATIQPGLPDDPSPMALSGGVAEVDDFHKPFDRHYIDADYALKLAKDRGRSRIEIHSSGNSTLIRRHDQVMAAADLREALRKRQLLLYAQPIRLLADRSHAPGFELLLRMRDDSGEIRPPADFIAAAQRFQLLPAIDRYVVDAAFESLSPHRALLARLGSSISINVSGQSFTDEPFIDHFIERLHASRVPPGLITVEVTEQAAVTNLAHAGAMMKRLREAGCGIALDDFGTGANSLAYLRNLPVTRIKIDGSFIRDLLTSARSAATVNGILQLAKEFGLDIVAEYIENETVAARLEALGVQHGQGYLFGKPVPLELALQKLAEEEEAGLRQLFASH
ncbi:MAG: bifunctional diguanylate cyclase/phosphodiesterase [Steroidobacteraceae bacterium]